MSLPRYDVHQHLWPEAVRRGARAAHRAAVRAARRPTGWTLASPASPTPRSTPPPHDPARAPRRLAAPGSTARCCACRARSASRRCPPPRRGRCSTPGTTACSRSARRSASGARSPSTTPTRADVDALLDRGAIGLSLPAAALATAAGARRVRPLLERARGARRAAARAPRPGARRRQPPARRPWWPALTSATSPSSTPPGMAFAAGGRPAHPRAAGRASRRSPAARRCTSSASPPAAARRSRALDPLHVLRHVLLRPAGDRRRRRASSASTSSSTARTGRSSTRTRRPPLGPAARDALASANPSRLLARRGGRARGAGMIADRASATSTRAELEELVAAARRTARPVGRARPPRPDRARLRGARPRRPPRRSGSSAGWRTTTPASTTTTCSRRRRGRRAGRRSARTASCSAARPRPRATHAGGAFSLRGLRHPPRPARRRRARPSRVHAYSPPLWRMGAYEVRADGELRRHSVSYAEELRPLAEAAV